MGLFCILWVLSFAVGICFVVYGLGFNEKLLVVRFMVSLIC